MTSTAPPVPRFRRLALTHAAMMGGEAAMVVALADSFFFDVDPSAARTRVLLFLLVSFAPFLLVAPLIGPVIDRTRGGRRFVILLVAIVRAVLQVLMVAVADQLALFPLVFLALVLQKTYQVSKSALVPSVVRTEDDLVEANSKLGLIAGITGAVAVVPAGLLQITLGTGATLWYGAAVFVVAAFHASRLPHDAVTEPGAAPVRGASAPESVQLASIGMATLRCGVGFVLFHLAFLFRAEDVATIWFGAAVGLASLGTMLGNLVGPRLRDVLGEEHLMTAALVLPTVVGVGAAVLSVQMGRAEVFGVIVAFVVNLASALGRLAFESVVQRDGPVAVRGALFARFETRFQLGWVLAGTVPVLVSIPGPAGYLLVGAGSAAAGWRYWTLTRR